MQVRGLQADLVCRAVQECRGVLTLQGCRVYLVLQAVLVLLHMFKSRLIAYVMWLSGARHIDSTPSGEQISHSAFKSRVRLTCYPPGLLEGYYQSINQSKHMPIRTLHI